MIRRCLDYAIFPFFVVSSMVATRALQAAEVPNLLITPIVVGVCVACVFVLEKTRPERAHLQRDFSLWLEACHFIFSFELGYGTALVAISVVEAGLRQLLPVSWPSTWPLLAQLLLVFLLYEALSYWQHRLFHRRPRLWAFHALHHAGARLDFIRAGRFHCVDFATVGFGAYLPLVVVGAPADLITMMAVQVSVLGLLHHGNVRQRTPAWLDWLICTPALHQRHHSKRSEESDANFGNSVMIFDHLFGTYAKADANGPASMGIEDEIATGFWGQFLGPFVGRLR